MERRYALALVVVGILIVLGVFLIIARNLGDGTGLDTDDPTGTSGMHSIG